MALINPTLSLSVIVLRSSHFSVDKIRGGKLLVQAGSALLVEGCGTLVYISLITFRSEGLLK